MKPLEQLNLGKLYGASFDVLYDDKFCSIVDNIAKEENPLKFRAMYFDIMQLYFDFLVDKVQITPEQEKIWGNLCIAGKNFVGSFYRGNGIDSDSFNYLVDPNLEKILGIAGNEEDSSSKHRHCAHIENKIMRFGVSLPEWVEKNLVPDTLVSVATGAFEPTFLAMDILEMDYMLPIRYSKAGRTDRIPRILENGDNSYPGCHIHGKNVLVVEDVISSGESIEKVSEFVRSFGPKKIGKRTVKWDERSEM